MKENEEAILSLETIHASKASFIVSCFLNYRYLHRKLANS